MQIHSFAAQHTFIYRIIFIAFYRNAALWIFINNNSATYTAIAANSCSLTSVRRRRRSFSKIVYSVFVIQLAGFIKCFYAATVSVISTGLTNFVSAVLFIVNRTINTIRPTVNTILPRYRKAEV